MPAALAGVALNTDVTAEAATTERPAPAMTDFDRRFIRDVACMLAPPVGLDREPAGRNDEAGARPGNRCTRRRPPTTSASSRPHPAACCPASKPPIATVNAGFDQHPVIRPGWASERLQLGPNLLRSSLATHCPGPV